MKRRQTATRISLAYRRNSDNAVLYRPGSGELQEFERTHGYAMTIGSCLDNYPNTPKKVGFYWMIHFHHATARDGVDPKALHQVLCQIPEFRDLCADDVPEIYKYSEQDEEFR